MSGKFASLAAAGAFTVLCASAVQAEPYPTHAVRIIVSSNAGGNPDLIARLLAARMTDDFGKAVVVENVTGAGGSLAALAAVKAPPDGHTILVGDSGIMAINHAMKPGIGYDPIKDFTPITALAAVPTILVANPRVPAATLAELIVLAKKEPGKISYGSAGVGSIHHLTMAIFAERVGIDVLHVPYRAGTDMVAALIGGDVGIGWSGIPNVKQPIETGQLRGYCISVLQRSPSTPTIPTCDELGIRGFDVASVLGMYAPAGTPAGIVERLQAEIAKVMREPAMAARMEQLGMIMKEDGTASYVRFSRNEVELYADIVRKLHLEIK